jgi:hypothetical protein
MKLFALLLLVVLLFAVPVFAEDDTEEGPSLADIISSLASAIPQAIFSFVLNMLNQCEQPLLDLVKQMISQKIEIGLFFSTWQFFVYVISLFYGLLFLYSGFNFIISGHDPVKRQNAKLWLQNTVVMIVLTQASFFLYGIFIDINTNITSAVLGLIDSSFFVVEADNILNFGVNFLMSFFYSSTLFATVILLGIRFILVMAGVILCPIGIFLYFVEPLKGYGKLILNFLGICIFITFFEAVILLTCSGILQLPAIQDFKIVILIAGFSIVNLVTFYFMLFSAIKSAMATGAKTAFTIGMIAKWFA